MKLLVYIFSLVFTLFLGSVSKEYNQDAVRIGLAYKLINDIIVDTTDICVKNNVKSISETALWFPSFIELSENEFDFYKNLFNENDTVNIIGQLENSIYFEIDSTKIRNVKILPKSIHIKYSSSDEFWNYLYENNYGAFIAFSKPIFSKDNSFVCIRLGVMSGRLWGEGESRLYMRKNDKWILIKSFDKWIS